MRCLVVRLILCAALPCCGCLYMRSYHEVVRDQEPKRGVAFQSETASRVFCAAVERQRKVFHEGQVEELIIPFITCITRSRTLSEAGFYNDQVAVCDTNADGLITEAEAGAYDAACGLVQTGEFAISFSAGPYEVRYPKPYASPPELTFVGGDGGIVDKAKLEETAYGFKVYTCGWTTAGALKWQARGIPARTETVQRVSAPQAQPASAPQAQAAMPTVLQVKLNGPVEAPETPAK